MIGPFTCVLYDQSDLNSDYGNSILYVFVSSVSEYAACSRITSKVDVYSYGIVLLEMVSGRSPTCEMFLDGTTTLRQWVVEVIGDGNPLRVVAPQFLERSASSDYSIEDETIKLLKLGLVCSSDAPQNRPTMREVVNILSRMNN